MAQYIRECREWRIKSPFPRQSSGVLMHRFSHRLRPLPLAAIALGIAALCAPSLKASQSPGWSVVVAANAFVTHGQENAANPIAMGASVEAGDHLSTREGGSLVLSRGEDLVTM